MSVAETVWRGELHAPGPCWFCRSASWLSFCERSTGPFLALARPPVLKPEPVEIGDLVAETAGLIEPEARRLGVRLEQRLAADLPRVTADRDRLKQVLLNLTRNALEAMPDGGTLRMEAASTARPVTLAVVDSGPGIPAESRARLFEPYYTTRPDGSGIGLWIAQQIILAHGGSLQAANAPEGGAVFTIRLPLQRKDSANG